MPEIEVHPSIGSRTLEEELAASLRANRLSPKLLYVTPRQAELWREVSLKHSPIHTNPEFLRIYRDAYEHAVAYFPQGRIWLVGLGSGTGRKEAELARQLISKGHEVWFSAIDVSRDLVEEAARRVGEAGARVERHLVCDLAEIDFIRRWLGGHDTQSPRIYTFFGLVPNLESKFVARLFRSLLRQVDMLLASVHLAPVGDGLDLDAAMRRILPQYDNAETLAWLDEAMSEWKLNELMREPGIIAGQQKTLPFVGGFAQWKSHESYLKFAPHGDAFADASFQVFFSLRYTPTLFEDLLRDAGVQGEMLAMTSCREEAIWAVRSGA